MTWRTFLRSISIPLITALVGGACADFTLAESDHDQDGWTQEEGDCDDNDPDVNAGATEVCNGIDDNCDGSVDEGFDDDADGYTTCGEDGVYETSDDDCNDAEAAIHPDAMEEACDGIDNDCDDTTVDDPDADGDGDDICVDCDDGDADLNLADEDGDGYDTCDGDCNDHDPSISPEDGDGDGASSCDGDCDDTDATANLDDLDADGWSTCEDDCDDDDDTVHPSADDVCDDVLDNDCDGVVDAMEADGDGDGASECEGDCDDADSADNLTDADADGYDTCAGDCDDGDATVYPGATELCDGVDNDCDGAVPADEVDGDGDGYRACEECDDADAAIFPGGAEVCDGLDNDCDGTLPADELDGDGDTYLGCEECDDTDVDTFPGAPELCDGEDNDCNGLVPADEADQDIDGFRGCDGDCDDASVDTYPGAPELCDGLDNDCDTLVPADEADLDLDGYRACEECDDADAAVFPGGAEVCDGLDNDCDGVVPDDELDDDLDGASPCEGDCDDGDATLNLDDADLDGWTSCDGDCDDGEDQVHPGATEDPDDWLDNDCDARRVVNLTLADAKLLGEGEDHRAGRHVSPAGDIDGDGVGDLLVGALRWITGVYGRGYLLSGPVHGTVDLGSSDAIFDGTRDRDTAGANMSEGGDVNDDGHADVLVGARYDGEAHTWAGKVYLVHGPISGTVDLATAAATMYGEEMHDQAGIGVSGGGDVNGDGYDDILIGAYGNDHAADAAGSAYLVLGPVSGALDLSAADARLRGVGELDHAGIGVSIQADVNGDGLADMLVGAPGNSDAGFSAGAVYLVHGPVSGEVDLNTADGILHGTEDVQIGWSMSEIVGDYDGDGFDDVLIGSPDTDLGGAGSGAAHLITGPFSGVLDAATVATATYVGQAGDSLGYTLSFAGDFDGDGYDDVLLGAPGHGANGSGSGATYLSLGGESGTLAAEDSALRFLGEAADDSVGIGVSSAGDLDDDGYDDIVLSAQYNDEAASDAGAAYVIYGGR